MLGSLGSLSSGGARRRGLLIEPPILTTPTFVGYAAAGSAAPTFPTHQIGDLCIGIQQRNTGTVSIPDAAAGWTEWEAPTTGTSGSVSIAWKIATTAAEVWGTWSQVSGRYKVWILRDAQIGVRNAGVFASSTALNWPSLSIADNSFVGASLFCNTSQTTTSVVTEGPTGLAQDRESTTITLGCDTDATLLNTFNPGNPKVLDVATVHNCVVWSATGI